MGIKILTNPFSDSFWEIWEFWKRYKKNEFGFSYKSTISEQSALNRLVRISDGNEKSAADIIRQSVEFRWKGLFPIQDRFRERNRHKISGESLNEAFAKYYNNSDKRK